MSGLKLSTVPELNNTVMHRSTTTKRLLRHPLAITGGILILCFTLLAVLAPVITAPTIVTHFGGCARDLGLGQGAAGVAQLRNPFQGKFWRAIIVTPMSCLTMPRSNQSGLPQPPSSNSFFGTLPGGYDIYYGVVWGVRMAFILGLMVSGINFVVGFLIGGLAGYAGGRVDTVLMRFGEVMQVFPSLVFAILFVALCGRSLLNTLIALALVGWVGYARIIRADILRVKQFEFVDGARAIGVSPWRLFFKHIIPNALGSLVVVVTLDIGAIVLTGATLSFVGLGFQEGVTDWGQMFGYARSFFLGPPNDPFKFWYVSFYPGLAMLLFTVAWNFIGNAYQDVLEA